MKSAAKFVWNVFSAVCFVYALIMSMLGFVKIGEDIFETLKERKDRKAQK